MEAAGRAEKAPVMSDRAGFGIGSAIIEPPDAGERDRCGAHCAGFERHIEIALVEAGGLECGEALFEDEHFGMGGRIGAAAHLIACLRDDVVACAVNEAGADRHFILLRGLSSLLEGDFHKPVLHGFSY